MAVAGAGARLYLLAVTPAPGQLRALALAPLARLFDGRIAPPGAIRLPAPDRIEVEGFWLPRLAPEDGTPAPTDPGLEARRVVIHHDPLALASLAFEAESVQIEGVRVATRETPSGIAADFPLRIEAGPAAGGRLPAVRLVDGRVTYRARKDSGRLRPGSVLVVAVDRLELRPLAAGPIAVDGVLRTLGLGQDDAPISLSGTLAPDGSSFAVEMRFDPVQITPELLSVLSEEGAAWLRTRSLRHGTLVLKLTRDALGGDGTLTPVVQFTSGITREGIAALPGLRQVEARTREQIEELFAESVLQVELGEGRLDVKSLVTDLAGGRAQVTGWIDPQTGALRLEFTVQDLRLEDPGLARALGPDAASVFEEFDARGLVDAVGTLERAAGGAIEWSVDVLLAGVGLRFVGRPDASGRREGFPYPMEDASGRVRIRPDGLYFDDVVGFYRRAELRIRGHQERGWTGMETGVVRFTPEGPDVRLTVEALNVPVDETLLDAIAQSDFSEILEDIELSGVVDRVEVDLVQVAGRDAKVRPDVRITVEGEEFLYRPFALKVEDVRGTITLRHPLRAEGRGKVWAWSVTGWAEGAPLEVDAEAREHEGRGRLVVRADGIPLAGGLTHAVRTSPLAGAELAEVWAWLEPRGRARVVADLPMGDDPDPARFAAELLGASIRLDAPGDPDPIEFSAIDGMLRVEGGEVRLEGLAGRLAGAPATVAGRIRGGADGEWHLEVDVDDLRVDRRLLDSLAHLADGPLLPQELRIEPGSRLDLALVLARDGGTTGRLGAVIDAREIQATLRFPEGDLLHLAGGPVRVKDGWVDAEDVSARAEGMVVEATRARLRLAGPGADADPGEPALSGAFRLRLADFELREGLLDLIPGSARAWIADLTRDRLLGSQGLGVDAPAHGPTTLTGDLAFVVKPGAPVGDAPRGRVHFEPLVFQDAEEERTALTGRVRLEGFSLDVGARLEELSGRLVAEDLVLGTARRARGRVEGLTGRVEGVRVTGLNAPVRWEDEVLAIGPVSGRLAGGRLEGDLRLHTAAPGAYEARLAVHDLDLARLGEDLAPSGTAYRGRARLSATLQNPSGRVEDLAARGELTVRDGDLGDLPFVANVLALGASLLGAKERPRFETADLAFEVRGELIVVRRLELGGPLFRMPGSGTVDFDGVADLTLRPAFVKSLLLPGVMQMPVVGDVLGGVLREDLFYAVRLRGDLATAEPELILLPPLGLDRGRTFEGGAPEPLADRRLPDWFR